MEIIDATLYKHMLQFINHHKQKNKIVKDKVEN